MAKILISPLGVGGQFQNQNQREYRETCYRIDDTEYPKSRFVASVLYQHLKLDGIVFIGTVKSMWEEVYRFFCEVNHQPFEEEYWLDLATTIDSFNAKSSIDDLDLNPLNQVLGKNSKCILIKYGLNEREIWENLEQIIQVKDFLDNGDEVYLDITHSFRSLALFQFLTFTFINDLLVDRNIKIKGVYYGMLDVNRELGYTPIIDLGSLFEMMDWIKGAYSLKSYGDGDLIAQLLKAKGEDTLSHRVRSFSDAINLNYYPTIKQKTENLRQSLEADDFPTPFRYIKPDLTAFIKRFSNLSSDGEFQLELAGWYFENKRYATGYITLTEAIVTYVCEWEGKDIRQKNSREKALAIIHSPQQEKRPLSQLYFQISSIRNQIAHTSLYEVKRGNRFETAIDKALHFYREVKQIFQTKTLG